jgi:hypothetical protein
MAFALSGAKHAVPLLQVQAQFKTRLKILCRDVGQDARTSTYGVYYSSHDVTRCRTFCQVSLSGLSSAFLGAGANLQEGAEPAPFAGQQGVDWLTKSVRRRQQVGVGTVLMGEFGEKCTYLMVEQKLTFKQQSKFLWLGLKREHENSLREHTCISIVIHLQLGLFYCTR